MRTRYWGLYDVSANQWLTDLNDWKTRPQRRARWSELSVTTSYLEERKFPRCIVPRPFYVTTKPRKLPPEAQAVIDAAIRFDYDLGNPEIDTSEITLIWGPMSNAVCKYKQWLRNQ